MGHPCPDSDGEALKEIINRSAAVDGALVELWRGRMDLFDERPKALRRNPADGSSLFLKLKAGVAVSCLLVGTFPGYAQQAAPQAQANPAGQPNTQGLPQEPAPNYTQPLYMRPGTRDFAKPRGYWPNPIAPYEATSAPAADFLNSPRLENLVKDGKIYLSLSDAIVLALENNYDIAIQRYNLNIADTDLLRARAGSGLLGVNSGLVSGTLGSSGTTVASGGGPGGTSVGAGGAGSGAGGLALTTNGGGPTPENMDPVLTGTIELQRQKSPEQNTIFYPSGSLNENTNTYNFTYNQGFITGTNLQVAFNNNYTTSNGFFSPLQPGLSDDIQRAGYAASAAGVRTWNQRPVYRSGKEQPAHCRLCVPPAVAVHD